ncbi:hypothetical protein [Streptomyces sp. KL116D]|uniref:hypothetical protein n=1 Tax=Streptomyces sp. KL116D TaxID=3045152 RepID=UPI00355612BE
MRERADHARFGGGRVHVNAPGRRGCLSGWCTLDYCRELGVPIEVFTNTNADAYLFNESAGMTAPMRYRTARPTTGTCRSCSPRPPRGRWTGN